MLIEFTAKRLLTLFKLVLINLASIRAVLVVAEIVEKLLDAHQSAHHLCWIISWLIWIGILCHYFFATLV